MPNCYLCGEPGHWIMKNKIPVFLHYGGPCRLDIQALLDAISRAFTRPAICPNPECRRKIFFHQSANGGRVFFDALGPPWPKHLCTSQPKQPESPCVSEEGFQLIRIFGATALAERQQLRLRFHIPESRTDYDLTLKRRADIAKVVARLQDGATFCVSIDRASNKGVLSTFNEWGTSGGLNFKGECERIAILAGFERPYLDSEETDGESDASAR